VASPAGDIEAFANRISRKRIGPLGRRGKYLIAPLIDTSPIDARYGAAARMNLVLHMGMTGSLHLRHAHEDAVKYRRASIFLDDSRRTELNDSRRWARLWAVRDAAAAMPRLAAEPWQLTPAEFAARLRARRMRVKPALLDQSLIAGVGNIYADEALHRAGISPMRRCNRITKDRLQALHRSILDVLEHAIEFITAHPSEDGSPYVVDAHDGRMRIARDAQSRCPECAASVASRRISGRTAYYCPYCQR